ncbi:MAG: hypothetical protein KDA45_15165, partial [Planctomycetales bacterium]|nr:hypothetical protein [Planctomycetales bacterium]
MSPSSQRRPWPLPIGLLRVQAVELLLGGSLLLCLAFLFYPGLIASRVPAFRDAYHFYYPQAVWLDACVQRGEYFPVWNAAEGWGVSVAGQPSAALYYPGRLLWLLPGLSTAQRFSFAIVAHLLLAALGIRYAAARIGLSRHAAWLAAFSYSLSCPILFQHNNFIYLCSAAWIGFAIAGLVGFLQHRSVEQWCRSGFLFSAACCLMLLGGDPHTLANTLLVAGGTLLWYVAGWPRGLGHRSGAMWGRAGGAAAWFACGGLLIATLTAVQWLPALRWASHSARLGSATAQLPELPAPLDTAWQDAPSSTHRLYDFSLSPWHLVTGLWPTLGGHYLPHNSRLFTAIPAEGRMWIPSLYFGLLPCLLLWLAFRRPLCNTRPLRLLALFALLASLGNYSLLWLLRELLRVLGGQDLSTALPKDHITSLYWLLTE